MGLTILHQPSAISSRVCHGWTAAASARRSHVSLSAPARLGEHVFQATLATPACPRGAPRRNRRVTTFGASCRDLPDG